MALQQVVVVLTNQLPHRKTRKKEKKLASSVYDYSEYIAYIKYYCSLLHRVATLEFIID